MARPSKISLFKPHIETATQYKGGVTRGENTLKAGVEKVYKMSSNENALGASPKAVQAILDHLNIIHEYSYHDDDRLRDALAAHFSPNISPDQFITANSGMELLDMFSRGFLEPGLECIVSMPTFGAYRNFAQGQGGVIVDIPLKGENFELDVPGILAAVNQKTRMIYITNPNNPTGTLIPKDVTDSLINSLPDHIAVIYDEVYYHYANPENYARAIDYINAGKNVIGLHSFSKSYGLAGLRLGYAFSTPEMAAYLNKIRRPFMINTLTMEAGLAALGDYQHIADSVRMNADGKQWLYHEFERLGTHYWPTEANFILFKSPIPNDLLIPKMMEYGIMIRPTELLGIPGCARVTIGMPDANRAFIDALKKVAY